MIVYIKKYWWLLLIICIIIYAISDVPILLLLKYLALIMGGLLIFPLFFPLIGSIIFAPLIFTVEHAEHFKLAFTGPWYKRYIFLPATLVAIWSYSIVTIIFTIWILVKSYLIWAKTIGGIFAFLIHIFLGPLALIVAPFITLIRNGFMMFIDTFILFFLVPISVGAIFSLGFSEDYFELTPIDFMGYSPHFFMIGALSFQAISLPFYLFGLFGIGDIISWSGIIFLLLTFIAEFKWVETKEKLSKEEKEALYKPSILVYIFSLLFTGILYYMFQQIVGITTVPTIVIGWFFCYLVVGLIGTLFRKLLYVFKQKKS